MSKEEMGKYRPQICDIISEMLDNPNENGIYGTTVAYKKLDDLIDQALSTYKAELLERLDLGIEKIFYDHANKEPDGTHTLIITENHELDKFKSDIKSLIEKDKEEV